MICWGEIPPEVLASSAGCCFIEGQAAAGFAWACFSTLDRSSPTTPHWVMQWLFISHFSRWVIFPSLGQARHYSIWRQKGHFLTLLLLKNSTLTGKQRTKKCPANEEKRLTKESLKNTEKTYLQIWMLLLNPRELNQQMGPFYSTECLSPSSGLNRLTHWFSNQM